MAFVFLSPRLVLSACGLQLLRRCRCLCLCLCLPVAALNECLTGAIATWRKREREMGRVAAERERPARHLFASSWHLFSFTLLLYCSCLVTCIAFETLALPFLLLLRPPAAPAFDHLINKFMKLLPLRHTRAQAHPVAPILRCSFSAASSCPPLPPALPVNIRLSLRRMRHVHASAFVHVPRLPRPPSPPRAGFGTEKFCNCSSCCLILRGREEGATKNSISGKLLLLLRHYYWQQERHKWRCSASPLSGTQSSSSSSKWSSSCLRIVLHIVQAA